MKELEREIIDNSTNSPRFQALKEYMDKWLELYQEEDDDEGIDMILLGWDKKYKHAIQFSLTGKNDPIGDIFDAFNHGFGKLEDNLKKDIFNGMTEYLAYLFVDYPGLYEKFQKNIEILKDKKKKKNDNKDNK